MLVHLDLFSGIGGFALACEWVGIETIGFVEIDKYCQKVLRKHFPSVPIVEDIRDVGKIKEIVANATGEGLSNWRGASLANAGAEKPESKRCDSTRSRLQDNAGVGVADRDKPTILITGGFPCQPFSVAGKRRGTADNRYLWNEMFAVIKAIKPAWVLAENVAGIAGMEFTDSVSGLESEVPEEVEAELSAVLDRVCADLEEVGYEVQPIIIPAVSVGAWHRRDRIWIMANTLQQGRCERGRASRSRGWSMGKSETQGNGWRGEPKGDVLWAVEPELGRVAHGIPNRVDRLKCLGNAIVPQVAYQIIKGIVDYENNSLQDQH